MSNNPLKQYFRQPAIYFALPSGGKYYAPGVVNIPPNGELPVYPMSSLDEIAIRTPDGLFNGDSTVRVIKSCVPDILDPWQLNNIDLEAVIVAIRAASVDGKMEILSTCPSCEEESKYDIDLLRLLAEKVDIDYTKPLQVGELAIHFRPLTYAESNENSKRRFEIERLIATLDEYEDGQQKQAIVSDGLKKMNDLVSEMIVKMIAVVQTPETTVSDDGFIREFLSECDVKTSNAIKDYSISLRQQNDSKPLQIKCINCQHEYKQGLILNFTDFFV